MNGDRTACPFCTGEVTSSALVCRACGRDIAIPEHLRAEHAELTRTRDRLRHELEDAKASIKASIASRASRPGSR